MMTDTRIFFECLKCLNLLALVLAVFHVADAIDRNTESAANRISCSPWNATQYWSPKEPKFKQSYADDQPDWVNQLAKEPTDVQ